MKIPPVKGTRDFYPEEMAVRNFIFDGWRRASLRNGFEEYDGPIFEYLQMYQIKSGDEIVEQLFNMTDRGGRQLAIRPEITPTLARMVNQKISSLPRPVKWFSMPRLCRAERPQKGRLREFFQWNIDVIGIDDMRADAEVIYTTVDYLRSVGLKACDIRAKISSRRLLANLLLAIGVAKEELDGLYPLLDKKSKLDEVKFREMLGEKVADSGRAGKIMELMAVEDVREIGKVMEVTGDVEKDIAEVRSLFALLERMGIGEYCRFDMGIVRGLAYYTGMVFEVHDICGDLRAICGGGRYDNLLRDFGGPAISATGMGMGDCVLEILLREKGLISDGFATKRVDYFVAYTDKEMLDEAIVTACELRRLGYCADFCYKAMGLGKQLKQASGANARVTVILGEELAEGKVVVKDMVTGEQHEETRAGFFERLAGGAR